MMAPTPSAIRGANSTRMDPYTVILAYRDPSESEVMDSNFDLKTLRYPFRICDYRDSVNTSVLSEEDEESQSGSQKHIKIRGYFSCG